MNDGQKFMGSFALALLQGGVFPEFTIPFWVMLICALSMGLGTALGGWRIIGTISKKMTRLTSWQGFAAQGTASCIIYVASSFGIPLSTTHTITSSIAGAGASNGAKGVRWRVFSWIALGWMLTFPICMALAYVSAFLANYLAH